MGNRLTIAGKGLAQRGYNVRVMNTGSRARWIIFVVPVILLFFAAGVLLARSLEPRYKSSLINRLPAFMQPVARALILPVYPDVVATPIARATSDVSSLLTPHPTQTPTSTPTPTPTSPPATPTDSPISPPATPASAGPTLTPVIPPGPTQAARSTPAAVESANVLLTGFRHIYQTWNNCGPATTSMNLSYYGWPGGQADAAKFLKPNAEDVNVSPDQIVAYAQSQGFNAIPRFNGTLSMLKQFLQAGIPVLIEKGFEPDATSGWEGHYELIVGYNDAKGEVIAMDSYTGPNQAVPYDLLDWYWSHFNRTYIIVYTNDQANTVMQLLGSDADAVSNYAGALAKAQSEAAANPSNAFAWFNVGSSFVALGEYESAAAAYDQARSAGLPWRMTWYQFGIFESYYRTGRYDDVIALADATLARTPYIEELWYYRGLVHQARGEIDAAQQQFQQALAYNANFKPAADALATLGQ